MVETIEEQGYDAVLSGARRDEERARVKECIFSVRDSFGGWDPRCQRPELWNLYNGGHLPGENIRVFPISNWTEADIWEYIGARDIELPSIYFAHDREVFNRTDCPPAPVAPASTLVSKSPPYLYQVGRASLRLVQM